MRYEWWEHPDRPCKDRDDWMNIKRLSRERKATLQALCLYNCPVLMQCRLDLLAQPWEHYGIQAGVIGKS